MAGLLNLTDDPTTLGLLSLGLRLMSTPGKFSSALGQSGLGAMDDVLRQSQLLKEQKRRDEEMRLRAEQAQRMQTEFEAEQRNRQAQQRQAQARDAYLASLSGQMGPPEPVNVPNALRYGLSAPELSLIAPPKKEQKQYSLGPGGVLLDENGKVLYTAPFKPDAPKLNDLVVPGPDGKPMINPVALEAQRRVAEARRAPAAPAGDAPADPTQADMTRRLGKAPAGYRWKPDGALEQIPGGPADQKAQTATVGKGTVSDIIGSLRTMYTQLDEAGGVTNPEKGAVANLGAGLSSSSGGQAVGRMFGTQNQSLRNTIVQQRPLLVQAIMKATGMSAKQLDSNAELKMYLATATDPTLDVASNRRALDLLEKLYGVEAVSEPQTKREGGATGSWGDERAAGPESWDAAKRARYEAWKRSQGMKP